MLTIAVARHESFQASCALTPPFFPVSPVSPVSPMFKAFLQHGHS